MVSGQVATCSMRPASRPRRAGGPGRDGLSRAYAAPKSAPFCTWSTKPMGHQLSPRVTSLPKIAMSSYLESKSRSSSGSSSVITTVATAPATPPRKLVCATDQASQGCCARTTDVLSWMKPRLQISEDGTHDEHPPAQDEVLQVVRQALDVFARLLFEAVHFDDLRDQHVIGLTGRLPGHVRRAREMPVRHRVQRPADDVPIPRHEPLKVLGELRGAQLEPQQKGRGRTDPRSVMHTRRATNACRLQRRGRDSNPRDGSTPPNGFQDRRIQPLCHPSVTRVEISPAVPSNA